MKLQNHLLLLAILLFSFNLSAQNNGASKNVKKTFYYTFEKANSEDQVDRLANEVRLLKGVTEVKSHYKIESKKGQIIVIVIEKEVTHEGDQEFDIRNLKELIIKNQLGPLELVQEETIIEN